MDKTAQVVLLIDIDSVCREIGDDYVSGINNARRICLRVLTGLAMSYCVPTDDHRKQLQQINLKFGYKYLFSALGKQPTQQRHHFVDFSIDSFEEFERNLEMACKDRIASTRHPQGRNSGQSPVVPRATGSVPGCLERGLKDLLCDYVWDNPTVSSPVRTSRSGTSRGAGELTADNFAVLLTRAPETVADLATQMSRKDGKHAAPSASSFLEWLLPSTVRKMFYGTLHIGLLWVDLSSLSPGSKIDTEKNESCLVLNLIDEALRRINGRIVPAEVISAQQPKVPSPLQFVSPLTSLVALSWRGKSTSSSVNRHVDLHLTSGEADDIIQLELLPLLRCRERCCDDSYGNTSVNGCAKTLSGHKTKGFRDAGKKIVEGPTAPTTSSCTGRWTPRALRSVGTLPLASAHRWIMARPLAFVCCESLSSATGQDDDCRSSLHQLLQSLNLQHSAMVVSCDSICLGILLPANSRCQVGVLHVIISKEIIPSQVELSLTPTKESRIKKFAQGLLADWELQSLTSECSRPAPPINNRERSLPLDVFEPFFMPTHCDRQLMAELKCGRNSEMLKERQAYFSVLQNLYLPVEPFAKNVTPVKKVDRLDRSASLSDGVRRSPRIARSNVMNVSERVIKIVSQSILSKKTKETELSALKRCSSESNMSQNDSTRVSLSSTSGGSDLFLSPVLTNEKDVVDSVRSMYDCTVTGINNLLTPAQNIINFVSAFFKTEHELKVKGFLTENALLTASQVTRKYTANDSAYTKDQRIREYCFQVFLWLEWMTCQKSQEDTSVEMVISHLRMLPFIAGPAVFLKFLNDDIIERYYPLLEEVVVTICEELNQPPPSNYVNVSSDEEETATDTNACSPDKFGSVPSQLSTVDSNMSSSSSQSRSRRGDAFHRHPSYASIGSSRQIVVSKVRSRSWKEMPVSERVTRSAEKRRSGTADSRRHSHLKRHLRNGSASQGFIATQLHFTPPKRAKPTTPNGRHVLKTKVVAETPTHKQVANAILHKQALGRKRNFESMTNDTLVVEESPDEKRTGIPLRRSPRTRHPIPLQRKASFYTTGQESKSRNVERACTREREKGNRPNNDTSFLLLDVTQSPWAKCPRSAERRRPQASKDDTPTRRCRAKRHLSMSGSFSPVAATSTRKENVTPTAFELAAGEPGRRSLPTKRSARMKLFDNTDSEELSEIKKTPKSLKAIGQSFSPSPRRSLRFVPSSSSWDALKAAAPTGRTRSGTKKNVEDLWSGNKWGSPCQQTPDSKADRSCTSMESPKIPLLMKTVSRKLLQTPAKLVQTPSNPLQTPSKLLPTPSKVLQTPVKLVQTPVKLVQTPVKLVQTPVKLVQTPVKLVQTPAKLLQTPSKLVQTPSKLVQTPSKAIDSQIGESDTVGDDDSGAKAWESQYFVPVTPQSFDEDDSSDNLCLFPPGPLACDKWEDHMSTSSSPYIPLFPDYDPFQTPLNDSQDFESSAVTDCDSAFTGDDEEPSQVTDCSGGLCTSPVHGKSQMCSPLDSSEPPVDQLGASVFESSIEEKNKMDPDRQVTTSHFEFAEIYHRFTRRESKEIGITPDDFRKISSDACWGSGPVRVESSGAFGRPKSKSVSASKGRAPRSHRSRSDPKPPASKKLLVTPPSVSSLMHLTTSPIVSPPAVRSTRNSLRRRLT